jgi:hypothetical protein
MKVKFTLSIEEDLLKKAKHYALDQDRDLSEIISELLEAILK